MKKQNKRINGFNIVEVAIIIIITCIVSSFASGVITVNNNRTSSGITYSELLKDDKVKEFLDVYSKVMNGYYEDVDKNEAIDMAIKGMMSYLGDEYTTYMNDSDTSVLNNRLSGTYTGIGISLSSDSIIREVFTDSPAEKAGLQENDKIVAVNDVRVSEMGSNGISKKIKESGDKVKLTILRDDHEYDFDVNITKLDVPSVSSRVLEGESGNIAYMSISAFSSSLKKQVSSALEKIEKKEFKALIIDLRGNGGGYLTSAKDVASMFLEKDKVIYTMDEKGKQTSTHDDTSEHREYPIVVLVNGASASASEILTAALKDSYGAVVVGTKTYGKGKVQQTYSLDDGGMVKYTSAKWLRPNGECVDEVGITPDYVIDVEYIEDENGEVVSIIDKQFEKAIEVINELY